MKNQIIDADWTPSQRAAGRYRRPARPRGPNKTTAVDLRPYEIFVRGDFLISVENLTHMPAGAKYLIRARLLARTYTRDTSQAPWKMRKAGVGLSVDVLVEPE